MTSTTKRRGRRIAASIGAVGLAVGVSMALSAAPAAAWVEDNFELEGDIRDAASPTVPDWGAPVDTSIFVTPSNNATNPVANPPVWRGDADPIGDTPGTFFDAGFAVDFIPGSTGEPSGFTGGGSKDINDVSQWKCKAENQATDKGDIQNAYSAVATQVVDAETHLVLYFGMEKNAPNGNNNMGVWFLQKEYDCNTAAGGSGANFVGVDADGDPITATHADGDIFLVAAFTGGGDNPQITAYKWSTSANGLVAVADGVGGECGESGAEALCAQTNNTAPIQTSWQTTNKGSATPANKTGQGTTLAADQFYEGAVDLTELELDRNSQGEAICVNEFLFNTRASQTLDATLYDYAKGDVQTCASPSISTLLYEDSNLPAGPQGAGDPADNDLPSSTGNHTLTAPAKVYDTSTLGGTFFPDADGTVTYTVYNNATCDADPASNVVYTETVGINADGTTIPASTVQTFSTPGTFYWVAAYDPSSTSRNEAAVSACNAEPLIIRAIPTLETTILLQDRVKVSGVTGGGDPKGNVVFSLWASNNCTGVKWYESASTALDANGLATSGAVAVAEGTYSWKVVFTPDTSAETGNDNYAGATTKCEGGAEETAVIDYTAPSPIDPAPSAPPSP